jgi:two-component system sensor histidine kinase UhpB
MVIQNPVKKKGMRTKIESADSRHPAKSQVKDSGRLYKLLAENVQEGIIVQDKNGRIIYANRKFGRMLGQNRKRLLGRSLDKFLDEPLPTEQGTGAAKKRRPGESYQVILAKKEGGQLRASITPAHIYDTRRRHNGTMSVIMDITDSTRIEEELTRSREELRNLSRHLQSVREEESKRIAREIHDEMGQALTALKMDLAWLSRRFTAETEEQDQLREKTRSMTGLIDQTIQLIQKISAELRPGLLDDLGLRPAIEWQVQDFQNRTGIKCKLTADDHDIEMDPDQATAIFRVFQESLTNVARHAEATRLEIILDEKDGWLRLVVRDNGKGISETQVYAPDALGFMGMRERLRPFNGKLSVQGAPRKGTTVEISLPLKGPQGQ